jgi:putative ABC transport system permease protein
MLRQAMILVSVGSVIGLFGAFSAARVASSLLFRVKLTDPPTIVGATLLLFAVALLACYMPASTASKVDPMVALRYE